MLGKFTTGGAAAALNLELPYSSAMRRTCVLSVSVLVMANTMSFINTRRQWVSSFACFLRTSTFVHYIRNTDTDVSFNRVNMHCHTVC